MTDQAKDCRHCRKTIPEHASVCFHCNRSQNYFLSKLEAGAGVISVISILLSIALVTLSWKQFQEATKQRKSADKAVQSADNALRQAAAAREDVLRARDEIRNTVEHLRTNIKFMLEVDYLTPKLLVEKHDPVRVGKDRQKLEEFAVPNEKERKKWLESLK
jgi:type II secretory pathway pseudopilin PulG